MSGMVNTMVNVKWLLYVVMIFHYNTNYITVCQPILTRTHVSRREEFKAVMPTYSEECLDYQDRRQVLLVWMLP